MAPTSEISSSLERFEAAWTSSDGKTVASFFTADGSLINPFGGRAEGRAAIAEMYDHHFAANLKGTSTTIKLSSVRRVDDRHTYIGANQAILGEAGDVVLTCTLPALLRNDGDEWRIQDARPYIRTSPA